MDCLARSGTIAVSHQCEGLREVGFSERDIWDVSAVAAFFNMSNRMASAVDMRPNRSYHGEARGLPEAG